MQGLGLAVYCFGFVAWGLASRDSIFRDPDDKRITPSQATGVSLASVVTVAADVLSYSCEPACGLGFRVFLWRKVDS